VTVLIAVAPVKAVLAGVPSVEITCSALETDPPPAALVATQ
jgi:hypothetical protein